MFTKLDLAALYSNNIITANPTLAAAVDSLQRANSPENLKLICQQITGYCRCLTDFHFISNSQFQEIATEMRKLKTAIDSKSRN